MSVISNDEVVSMGKTLNDVVKSCVSVHQKMASGDQHIKTSEQSRLQLAEMVNEQHELSLKLRY